MEWVHAAGLDSGVIDDQRIATQRLTELVTEMDRRYNRFKEARVHNLTAYNTKVPLEHRLPVIWVIHDEFAEWMLTEDYEAVATRCGHLSRVCCAAS